jgi:hypothetical protein
MAQSLYLHIFANRPGVAAASPGIPSMKNCAMVCSDLPMNTSQAPIPWKMTARRFGRQV